MKVPAIAQRFNSKCQSKPVRIQLFSILFIFLLNGCGSAMIRNGQAAPYQLTGSYQRGSFTLNRVELTFISGRPDLTAKRGDLIQAVAQINFSGQGNFRANWLVDDFIIESVNINLTHGSHLTLSLKHPLDSHSLQSGYHFLRLQVQQPAVNFNLPRLKFFLKAD